MKFQKLSTENLEAVLKLEEEMYWLREEWHDFWKKGVEQKFKELIGKYLSEFPSGCFGLFDESGKLLGALIFAKISEVKPIPYLHKFADYFEKNGDIAYVEIFAVRKGEDENEIARNIYQEAERVAKEIGCNKIAVVIYSSPVEESVLKNLDYSIEKNNLKWEICPGKFVDCKIYTHQL